MGMPVRGGAMLMPMSVAGVGASLGALRSSLGEKAQAKQAGKQDGSNSFHWGSSMAAILIRPRSVSLQDFTPLTTE